MAKKSLPALPSSSSEEDSSLEGSSSSDEEKPTSTIPAPQTPTINKEVEESDDESESHSEEESGDEEDEEDSKKHMHSSSAPAPKPESESEDDDSDSESDAAKLVTPISSKSMADVPAKKEARAPNPESEDEAAKLVTPISSKPMANVPAKKEKANGKATAFQRIWTLDDEIAILRGLVQFQSENGRLKLSNSWISDFYNMIKNKLSLDVTSSQLVQKLKRLKKKHLVIADRAEGGKPPQFAKPHDEAVYELGKKIWTEADETDERVYNGAAANSGGRILAERVGSLKVRFPFLKGTVESMGKRYADEALEMLDVTKAEALDKRLKRQMMAEMKHRVQEAELWKETLKLVTEGMERATN